MKIAVVYNRESQKVINLFGLPNREKYGLAAIQRIVDSLKKGGHQAIALEGDKDLIDRLEEFMPAVLKGERPGMVFNLSYGIQGQARYTHVPGILEMVGIPYVGSGPLAHSLALDKVVAKMIFRQQGLPTPDFAVLPEPGFAAPELAYPLIVKPKNESVSFGIKVVEDEQALREAAEAIFEKFQQAVLVEQYIAGREINVGLLGNGTPEAFEPAEIIFGEGPKIYTLEDKTRKSGREIRVACPAPLDPELTRHAKEVAIGAFNALGCYDCARVDMRLDDAGHLYILEINSLPSLGEHGSYVAAAEHMGLDFAGLVNRLVEVASARYFGTPHPPELSRKVSDPATSVFAFLTERRDRLEQRVQEWVGIKSRSGDPVGIQWAAKELGDTLGEIGLRALPELSDGRDAWCWESPAGLTGGTLLIVQLDVPANPALGSEAFRRDPEALRGEGVGVSRAPLTALEFALRSLKHVRRLKQTRLGVIAYADEGEDCGESAELISRAAGRAAQVLVLRPGGDGERVYTQRRGQRRYRLVVEGTPLRLGHPGRKPEVMRALFAKLEALAELGSRRERLAISAVDVKSEAYPGLLPHRALVTLLVSYLDPAQADELETRMFQLLKGGGLNWRLAQLSNRPPMIERRVNQGLTRRFDEVAQLAEIPLAQESSLSPSPAGLVPTTVPVLCRLGPVADGLYTAQESVSRISLIQRTLLLSRFLLAQSNG